MTDNKKEVRGVCASHKHIKAEQSRAGQDASRDHNFAGGPMWQPDRYGVLEEALSRARDKQDGYA